MLSFKIYNLQKQQQQILFLTVRHKKQFKDQIFVLLVIKDLYCFKAGHVYQKLIIVSSTETVNVIFVLTGMSSITMFVLKSQPTAEYMIKLENVPNVLKGFIRLMIAVQKYLNRFFRLSALLRSTLKWMYKTVFNTFLSQISAQSANKVTNPVSTTFVLEVVLQTLPLWNISSSMDNAFQLILIVRKQITMEPVEFANKIFT